MKKMLSLMLALLLLAASLPIQAADAANAVRVTYNGQTVDFDVEPRIVDGSTMVPLRKIFNLLGAEVEWVADTREVISVKGSDTVKFTIGSKQLYKNGAVAYNMPVPAMIVEENGESRTLVPLRAVSESFGYYVDWNGETRTAIIMSQEYKRTSEENGQLITYPDYDERIKRDYTYDVSVTQGSKTEKLTVYNHVMQNDIRHRAIGGDLNRRFAAFAFSDAGVRVDIKVKQDFESYTVFPSAKGLKTEFNNGVISVYLDKPEYFGIRLDDDLNSILMICADAPEENVPQKGDSNVLYIEGWYEPQGGYLNVPNANTTVYIAPGAVLNARVVVSGKNCKVTGRGAIVDPYENFYEYNADGAPSYLLTVSGPASVVDGPFLLDTRSYNIVVKGNDITVKNTKCFSSMLCSDGISVWSVADTLIENCVVYVGDNAVVDAASRTVARNLLLGTTCAAVYPQQNIQAARFEDIHVFRAGEGVVNNIYNANGSEQRKYDISFKNLYAVDCPSIPWFFKGRDMGTLQKVIRFENVQIPTPTGAWDIHSKGNKTMLFFENTDGYIFTENYDFRFTDLYMGGEIVTSNELKQSNPKNAKNEVSVAVSGKSTALVSNTHTVNYVHPSKVYIGVWEMFFKSPVKTQDGGSLLPYNEIKTALRSEKSAQTQLIDGIEYVTPEALVSAGLAREYTYKDSTLTLTPVYNGENMLLPDNGEISYFSEGISYQEELTADKDDDGYYFSVQNIRAAGAGIKRFITQEVRMYGAGKYRVTFSARANSGGEISAGVVVESGATLLQKELTLTSKWQEFSAEFDIRGILTKKPMTILSITAVDKSIGEFNVRDVKLEKIS